MSLTVADGAVVEINSRSKRSVIVSIVDILSYQLKKIK